MHYRHISRSIRLENRLSILLTKGLRSSSTYSAINNHYHYINPNSVRVSVSAHHQHIRNISSDKETSEKLKGLEEILKENKDGLPGGFELNVSETQEVESAEDQETASQNVKIEEYTKEVVLTMPDMDNSPGKLVKWYKQEGDHIHRGDDICDIMIESLNFTFGITSDDEGVTVMGKHHVQENDGHVMKANDPMCITWHKPLRPKKEEKDQE